MQRRPKKYNPKARKPQSRHQKEKCPYCEGSFSASSIPGHIAVCHNVYSKAA